MADGLYEAYCVKCKEKRTFPKADAEIVTMKNGMEAAKGVCSVCGTKIMRILGKAK